MPLYDNANQQLRQRLPLFGGQHGEQLVMGGDGVGIGGGNGAPPLLGEVGTLDAPVLGIGLTFDQTVLFQRGQRQLSPWGLISSRRPSSAPDKPGSSAS